MGSATVSVALFGVSEQMGRQIPLTDWCAGAMLHARRRDADGCGRDDRAPHPSTESFR